MSALSDIQTVELSRQPENGDLPPVALARVAMAGQRAALEWTRTHIAQGPPLDPLLYPLSSGLIVARGDLLGGLHGFLADSLPDAWGTRLLARRLRRMGVSLETTTCIQRLSLVGHHGRGALIFDPADNDLTELDGTIDIDIDALARAAQSVLLQQDDFDDLGALKTLEALGTGSGGARPKAHIELDGAAWIVKFPSLNDPADIGAIELSYMTMAKAAGLHTSPCRLLEASSGPARFATRRFDRLAGGGRTHMISLCGALEAPSGLTAMGYDTFLRATLAITRKEAAVEDVLRRMLFNILACNRDDHSRQHAYLQSPSGDWELAPAFDLTFSLGPGGEHELDINGEARKPTRTHVSDLAKRHGVASGQLSQMLEDVRSATSQWDSIAKEFGVSSQSRREIGATMTGIYRDFVG